MDIEEIAKKIVDAAVKVHTALGPGFLESAYLKCIAYQLKKDGLCVELGFLLNWNVPRMKDGIKRMVYHLQLAV
jgi:hypothetical protein